MADSTVEKKITDVIEKEIKPHLALEGGSITFVGVENGVVKVKLQGACAGCPMARMTLTNFVEETIKRKVPGVVRVEAVETGVTGL